MTSEQIRRKWGDLPLMTSVMKVPEIGGKEQFYRADIYSFGRARPLASAKRRTETAAMAAATRMMEARHD